MNLSNYDAIDNLFYSRLYQALDLPENQTRTGIVFENHFESHLKAFHDFYSAKHALAGDRYIIKRAPYKSFKNILYNEGVNAKRKGAGISTAEFKLVVHDALDTPFFTTVNGYLEILIQCKFQRSSGTTKDKIDRAINALLYSDSPNNLIILEGEQFTPEDIKFAKFLAANSIIMNAPTTRKNVVVMTPKEVFALFREMLPNLG